jgi:murein DD-endopeptidase MepM/ murein hydrolase activator NlpD
MVLRDEVVQMSSNDHENLIRPPPSLGAPQAVIAVAKDASAYIRWIAVSNADYYTVYRSTSLAGPFTQIALVPSPDGVPPYLPGYNNIGLTNGKVYFYKVYAGKGTTLSASSNIARVTPVAPFPEGSVQWPLSRSTGQHGDGIRYPFGPRNIGSYDFHAGIDIPAPNGTPIYPVMDGTVVEKIESSTGGQQKIVIYHQNNKWTHYLHVNHFAKDIHVGTPVYKHTEIAYVGKTGADHNHLHFTYVVKPESVNAGETRSKNPLEILPHYATAGLTATWEGNLVKISMPSHQMTVRWIILVSGGIARIADYYDIVSQGDPERDNHDQYGIHIDADGLKLPHPAAELPFVLRLSPATDETYLIDRVILLDFNGNVLLSQNP